MRGSDYFNAGDQKGAVCFQDTTGRSIVYTSDSPVMIGNVKRTTVLYLTCDSSTEGELQVQGEITQATYLMTLTSKHACPFTPSLLSPGTILIIVLVCLLFTYFIGGILYQTFYKKAVGIERIPHVTLWTSLPSLVKEGSVFALSRVTGKGYSKI
ncbi:cation-dependent mannose-6-phosphate receptor-like [Mytilus californianus]|uniref:cation-dependent mannose-6-phosphate receptor-like n=1 Tax=Mytilus californianus TaxID=6549 RepID=UPI002246133D|nr:cation-dependent mannose-6-phosphate receptor-like [Mytilus californianus]